MSKNAFKLKPLIVALTVLCADAWATDVPQFLPSAQPWSNRYTTQGLVGGHSQLSGFVDSMIPVFGTGNKLWFIDGSFLAGERSNHVLSFGAGTRQIFNMGINDAILGGYLFADYQHAKNHGNAWLLNPGVELLSNYYELRLQGYFPVNRRQEIQTNLMATQIPQFYLNATGQNVKNIAFAKGHSFMDTPVAITTQLGNGVEVEAGQYSSLWKGGWLRGGLYYFDFPNAKNVKGAQANLEVYLNRNASLILQDNYDNQNKNRFSIGLRVSFGGSDHTQVGQLSNRMEEPIIRHQARQSYGLASPIREAFVITGPTIDIASNVWFFSQYGTHQGPINLSSCTAENPCLDLTQDVVNGINLTAPEASLWFASGTYVLPSTGTDGFVNLYDGQALYGRTYDFSQPATGYFRPLIAGGLWWTGSGAINNLQVGNNNQFIPPSITGTNVDLVAAVGATGNMIANNVALTTTGIGAANVYGLLATSLAFLNNSTVNTLSVPSTANSTLTFNNSAVTADTIVALSSALNANSGVGDVSGLNSAHDIFVANSSIFASSGLGGSDGFSPGSVFGIFSQSGTIQLTESNVAVAGNGQVFGIVNSSGPVQAFGSQIDAFASNAGADAIVGISALLNNIIIANTTVSVSGSATNNMMGIEGNNLQLFGSAINVNATGSGAFEVLGAFANEDIVSGNSSVSTMGTASDILIGIQGNNVQLNNSSVAIQGNAPIVIGVESTNDTGVSNSNLSVQAVANIINGLVVGGNTQVTGSLINFAGIFQEQLLGINLFSLNSNAIIQGSVINTAGTATNIMDGVISAVNSVNMLISNSVINTTGDASVVEALTIFGNFDLENSTINVQSSSNIPLIIAGIEREGTNSNNFVGNIVNSVIEVSGNPDGGLGVLGIILTGPAGSNSTLTLNNSLIDVQNINSAASSFAFGIIGSGTNNEIDFIGKGSFLSVIGQIPQAIAVTPGVVNNLSTPPSVCAINGVDSICS